MKLYKLQRRQMVSRPLDEVFSFFSKPENLGMLTPDDLDFEILTPSPIPMKEGAVIDYTIRIAKFPVRWTTIITEYRPPFKFVDLQLRGPYAFWHHSHTFTSLPDGTLIEDEVHYALPSGFLGRILHQIIIRRQVENIFSYRAREITKLFSVKREYAHQEMTSNLETAMTSVHER